MSWLALAAGAIGTVISARSQVKAADAQRQSAQTQAQDIQYESQAAQINAQRALENADLTRKQYAENERRFRIKTTEQNEATRAQLSARGFTMEGSAEDVLASNAALAELDALTLRHEGELKARGYDIEASDQSNRGQYLTYRASRVTEAADRSYAIGRQNAASSLLTGFVPLLKMVG